MRLLQELEFEIDEVRFDEVEGAFEIEPDCSRAT